MRETTALGAAIAAGFAVGVWKEFDELKEINQKDRMIFEPNVAKEEGDKMFKNWEKVRGVQARATSKTLANVCLPFRQWKCVVDGLMLTRSVGSSCMKRSPNELPGCKDVSLHNIQ